MQLYTDKFHASTLFNSREIRTHAMKLKPVKGTVNVIMCDPSYIDWVVTQRCHSSEKKNIKIFFFNNFSIEVSDLQLFAKKFEKFDEIQHFLR